ncbi:MAG: hypothetical protein AABY86_02115, partial [Bdellovibrionota bacterium]
ALIDAQWIEMAGQIENTKQLIENAKTKLDGARQEMENIKQKFTTVIPGISQDGRELVPPTVVSPMEPKILQCHRKCQRMHSLLAQKARILQDNPDLLRRLVKDKSVWDSLGDFFSSTPPKPDEDKLYTQISSDDPEKSAELLDRALSQSDSYGNKKDGNISLESKGHSVMWDIKTQINSLCRDPESFVNAALTNPKMKALMSNCALQSDGMPHHQFAGKDVWRSYDEQWAKDCQAAAKNADTQNYICNKLRDSGHTQSTRDGLQTALQVGGDAADVVGCALIVGKGISMGAKIARAVVSTTIRSSARVGVRTAIAIGIRRGARAALRVEIPASINVINSTIGKVALVNMGLSLAMAADQQYGILNPDRHEYCNQIAARGMANGHFDLVSDQDREECKAHAEGLIQFARMALLSYAVGKFEDGSAAVLRRLAGNNSARIHYERAMLDRYEKLNAEEKIHLDGLPTHQQHELRQQLIAHLADADETRTHALKQKSLSELIDLYNHMEGQKYREAHLSATIKAIEGNDKLFGMENPLTKLMRESLTATELLHLEKIEAEGRTRAIELNTEIARIEMIPGSQRTQAQKDLLQQLKLLKEDMVQQRKAYYEQLAANKKGCV